MRVHIGVLVVVAASAAAPAQQYQGGLTVQPASSLTAGGSVSGIPVTQQAAGSLTTTYTGTTGITSLNLTANQMTFSDTTSNFVATVNGSWAPLAGGGAGTAPADYGGLLDAGIVGNIQFAMRNLTASIGASTVTLTPTGGGTYSFPANQTLTLTGTSSLDYRGSGAFAAQVGNASLVGQNAVNAGANGTLQDLGGGNFGMTYPVALTIVTDLNGNPATITLNGTLVSQGTLTPVPEPATVGLFAATALGFGVIVRRKLPKA